MTFYEQAKQSELDMAMTISFCMAVFASQANLIKRNDSDIQKFMKATINDVELWLKDEVPEDM